MLTQNQPPAAGGSCVACRFVPPLTAQAATAFLRSVVYSNIAAEPDLATRQFSLVVVDGGGFSSLGAATAVTIAAINDNSPMFPNATLAVSLREGDTGPLVTVHATDADHGPDGDLVYSILGTGAPEFRVTAAGEVVVTTPLDYEAVQSLSLRIQATDGGSPPLASVPLTITVTVIE